MLMKRLITSFIALLYFVISSGMVMNIHYCMGKVSSVQIDQLAATGCKCGKSKKEAAPKSCCKTELKVVKIQDSHKAAVANYVVQAPVIELAEQAGFFQLPAFHTTERWYTPIHAPPLQSAQDTYLLNCVFRI
jgi:hypothetical protein